MNLASVTFYDPELAAKVREEIKGITAALCKLGEIIKSVFERLAELFEEIRQKCEVKKKYPRERGTSPPHFTFIRYSGKRRRHKPP